MLCLVPQQLGAAGLAAARSLHAGDPDVTVLLERRGRRRRGTGSRRRRRRQAEPERRRVHGFDGRRVADRRAIALPVAAPLRLAPALRALRWVQTAPPSAREQADAEVGRLVVRIQSGEAALFDELYRRTFPDLFAFLRVLLGGDDEAEDAAQHTYVQALRWLPAYELRPGVPFRAWLYCVGRRQALRQLSERHRARLTDPWLLDRPRQDELAPDARTLLWITDTDLLGCVEALPPAQREVIVLRYMLDLRTAQIAPLVGRSDQAVRHLHCRALRSLEERLTALGWRAADGLVRAPMLRLGRPGPVLLARRLALRQQTAPQLWARAPAWT